MSALLPTRMVSKPWGRTALPAPFSAPDGERIGEIWFEPPPALDTLLVKYIFTSEALSVQVHPSDVQTLTAGLGYKARKNAGWLSLPSPAPDWESAFANRWAPKRCAPLRWTAASNS